MRSRAEYGLALLLDLLGAAGALLVSTRAWQTVVTPRPRPLADDVLRLSGRTVDPAPTALALVALAGVVAVLATRGVPRRLVGAALAAAGAGLVWRSVAAMSAVSAARARSLVEAKHTGVGLEATVRPDVAVHAGWPVLSAACGVLVLLAGALIAARGHGWLAMSAKYDAPDARPPSSEDEAQQRARADASLWTALDRGDDPTAGPDAAAH